uniref:Phospholipid transfer protein n=1 Tax=Salvator merianae TaxID=96440 RepID=A0A8D0E3E9_SALMN
MKWAGLLQGTFDLLFAQGWDSLVFLCSPISAPPSLLFQAATLGGYGTLMGPCAQMTMRGGGGNPFGNSATSKESQGRCQSRTAAVFSGILAAAERPQLMGQTPCWQHTAQGAQKARKLPSSRGRAPSLALPSCGARGTMAAGPPALLLLLLLFLPPSCLALATPAAATPACKIRITAKGLELVKQEGLRFVEQELENITIADLHGKEGRFHYNISNVKVTSLQLARPDLYFQPERHLAFNINNGSISLRFRRQILYWFFYDIGSINTSAEGVHIHTAVELSKARGGRLRISNVTCKASIARMQAGFSGTLRKVYEFLGAFMTTGMRFLLNQQICPALRHAGLVLLNSLLDTVPVRNPVDEHIGIDYSLLDDPIMTPDAMDLHFMGKFFSLQSENETLPNQAVEPLLKETERMVYMAVSEYFFDSALYAYYQAGVLSMEISGEKVPKDLEVLLRATFFGSIVMMNPSVVDAPLKLRLQVTGPPRCLIKASGMSVSVTSVLDIFLAPLEQPLVQLSSMTMLIPLQGPLKTLLQLTVMPIINERTKKGVEIPLPEGMDFVREVVTNHMGYLTVGADLHFSKGLREVIEKYRLASGLAPTPVTA